MASFKAVTFDYFGTLVDVDAGGEAGMKRALSSLDIKVQDPRRLYLQWDIANVRIYRSGPFRRYREIACEAFETVLKDVNPGPHEKEKLIRATDIFLEGLVKDAPPHSETTSFLRDLSGKYRLLPITNMDNDLFALSQLTSFFPDVITAEEVRAYKPSERIFLKAIEHLGFEPHNILHVSLAPWADIDGAKPLGMKVAWINRSKEELGVWSPRPDYEFSDLNGLRKILL